MANNIVSFLVHLPFSLFCCSADSDTRVPQLRTSKPIISSPKPTLMNSKSSRSRHHRVDISHSHSHSQSHSHSHARSRSRPRSAQFSLTSADRRLDESKRGAEEYSQKPPNSPRMRMLVEPPRSAVILLNADNAAPNNSPRDGDENSQSDSDGEYSDSESDSDGGEEKLPEGLTMEFSELTLDLDVGSSFSLAAQLELLDRFSLAGALNWFRGLIGLEVAARDSKAENRLQKEADEFDEPENMLEFEDSELKAETEPVTEISEIKYSEPVKEPAEVKSAEMADARVESLMDSDQPGRPKFQPAAAVELASLDDPEIPIPLNSSGEPFKRILSGVTAKVRPGRLTIVLGSSGAGKCWGSNTKLMLADGRTAFVQDIRAGDELIGDDSTPRLVQSGSLIRGQAEMFEVTSNDTGRDGWSCNGDHILVLKWNQRPTEMRESGRLAFFYETIEYHENFTGNQLVRSVIHSFQTKSLAEASHRIADQKWIPLIVEMSVNQFLQLNKSIQSAAQMFQPDRIQFQQPANCPSLHQRLSSIIGHSASDSELREIAHTLGFWLASGSDVDDRELGSEFTELLHKYDSVANKRFPHELLSEPDSIRKAILEGVIDGAGNYQSNHNGFHYELTSTQRKLIDGFVHLARSLGFTASSVQPNHQVNEESGKESKEFRVQFSGPVLERLQMSLPQKRIPATPTIQLPIHDQRCAGFSIHSIGIGDYYGFELDGNGRCLLNDFVISHNSSLLKILAGRRPSTLESQFSGSISLNGSVVDARYLSISAGFCMQDDCFLPLMTPLETLQFKCGLRSPAGLDERKISVHCSKILQQLGLGNVENSFIGNIASGGGGDEGAASSGNSNSVLAQLMRSINLADQFGGKGLSGGEQRRLSIGLELIQSNKLLILDECTSGLDSSTAYQVIAILKHLARSNNATVIASLHTPSMKIYELFDDLILMAKGGKLIYSGSISGANKFFAGLGFKCPQFQCPADYFIELLNNPDHCQTLRRAFQVEQKRRRGPRVQAGQQQNRRELNSSALLDVEPLVDDRVFKPSSDQPFVHQLRYLSRRNFLQFQRQRSNLTIRIAQYFLLSLFVGLLYYQCGFGQSSIYGRLAFLFFILSMSSLMVIVNAVLAMNDERQLFDRERAVHLYRISAYFIAKSIFNIETPMQFPLTVIMGIPGYYLIGLQAESGKVFSFLVILFLFTLSNTSIAFILGSATASPLLSIILTPVVIVPSMLTCGFFINLKSMSPWIGWFPYISPFYYAFVALLNNEFRGLKLKCLNPSEFITAFAFDQEYRYCPFQDGEAILELFGIPDHTLTADAMAIVALTVAYRLIAYLVFRIKNDENKLSIKLIKKILCCKKM